MTRNTVPLASRLLDTPRQPRMNRQPHEAHVDMIMSINPATDLATRQAAADWRQGLPTLRGTEVTLRELRTTDAPSLVAAMTSPEVSRFISPPPATIDGFER